MIYLATPYSHENAKVMHFRYLTATRIAGRFMAKGEHVFCPITHTHPIATECDLPQAFGFWQKYDEWFLSRCDKVVVVKMDGWQESKGVQAEIKMANELGIPVEFVDL